MEGRDAQRWLRPAWNATILQRNISSDIYLTWKCEDKWSISSRMFRQISIATQLLWILLFWAIHKAHARSQTSNISYLLTIVDKLCLKLVYCFNSDFHTVRKAILYFCPRPSWNDPLGSYESCFGLVSQNDCSALFPLTKSLAQEQIEWDQVIGSECSAFAPPYSKIWRDRYTVVASKPD